jgi:hypothetical protein
MKKQEKIETTPMKIHANAINMVIVRAYHFGGPGNVSPEAAIEAGRKCVDGLTDEQIIKIATGKARLVGCTPGPITYEEN